MSLHTKPKIKLIPAIIFSLVGLTILSGFLLSRPRGSITVSAVTSSAQASVVVPSACTLSGTIASGDEHIKTITPGTYEENIGLTTIKAVCNDPNGFDIYAVGYSGTASDLYNTAGTIGNTNMISSYGSTITTGLNTTTGASNWAMKLSLSSSNNGYTPNILSDTNGSFAEYHVIPSTSTKVATFNAITDSTTGSTITTTYRARVDNNQPAGTYIGQVKYTITHPTATFTLYMQDFTPEMCATLGQAKEKTVTLYDKRDNNAYTVTYINGQCWMTQNLRFTGTNLDPSTTNVADNTTMTYYSLDSSDNGGFGDYTGHCDSANGWNYACIYDSNSTSSGVWYNYAAATAGTIVSNSSSTDSVYDICPAGWHLPSGPSTIAETNYNKLISNTTSGWQTIAGLVGVFSPVSGGYYENGKIISAWIGAWWSASAFSTTGRYSFSYMNSINQFYGNGSDNRYRGPFVRCVFGE